MGGGVGGEDEDDMLNFRPNPSQLMKKAGSQQGPAGSREQDGGDEDGADEEWGGQQGKAGLYRPPRLNPVSMDGCVCVLF